uniref:Uncharacterized protein n=1 Tax=Romanomermis culicivorax TaxID=13658 RepID=A0A915IVH5_ROMCU
MRKLSDSRIVQNHQNPAVIVEFAAIIRRAKNSQQFSFSEKFTSIVDHLVGSANLECEKNDYPLNNISPGSGTML